MVKQTTDTDGKNRSGSKPQLSLSIPKGMIDIVKLKLRDVLKELAQFDVQNQSHLFRLIILHGKIEDGKLIVDLAKANDAL